MSILFSYIKSNRKTIFIFAVFSIIFSGIFSLYNLDLEAVFYAVILCVCTWIIFSAIDCLNFYKRHKLLQELHSGITLSVDGLPVPQNLIEKDYQELIKALYKEKVQLTSRLDGRISDMIDYYTLWAHQIKTPISAMHLLLQSEERENCDLDLELIKIEQYVEMVLQYLRLGSDFTDYVIGKYSLDDIVRQAVRKSAKIFISKKISLDFKESNKQVLTDEKWLLFVVEQILSNALKYTNAGKIKIYVEGFETLVIEDSGMGIRQEDLPRVFEKGFTGYNGRDHKKSTGIGLYLCKEILTKLSHKITIESEPGIGTKVKIDFNSEKMLFD